MSSLKDKIAYLKKLNETINSLESDITNTLNQNENFSKTNNKLKEHIKELTDENEKLIATKNTLTDDLILKEKEIIALKNGNLEQDGFPEDTSNISLGINNISVRNNEAIFDALKYFNKKCPYCNKELFVTTSRKQYEVDHFHPVVKGGQDVPWNLLPVCQSCNRKKRDIQPHIFLNVNSFERVSNYLKQVHENFKNEAIDSYTFKEKLQDLIENESLFIKRNIHSDFITNLLYLAEKHTIIKKEIVLATQKGYNEKDKKAIKIVDYLDKGVPGNWEDLDLSQRRNFLMNKSMENATDNLFQRNSVCTAEIWCEGLGLEKKHLDRYKSREINAIMKDLVNWRQSKATKRFPIYGIQRYYERIS